MFGLLDGNKALDTVSKGVDKVFFTDQEKTEMHIRFLKAYEPFKKLQRILAIIVGVPYVLTHLIGIYFLINDNFEKAMKISEYNNDNLGYAFGAVVTLYLGGGLIEGAIGKFKEKRG